MLEMSSVAQHGCEKPELIIEGHGHECPPVLVMMHDCHYRLFFQDVWKRMQGVLKKSLNSFNPLHLLGP